MENSDLITKALTYIQKACKENLSIDDVATHAGFSTDYFNRLFFAHTGFTVMEYVRFTRLKKGARLLRTGDQDILNIALECGYESHESFSRAFKKQYDLSPSEYRKKYEKTEAVYGDFFNDTIAARLTHEFPAFKVAPADDVIDWMLEHDAFKYGYAAICCHINGGAALYSGEDFREGFVWFTEWEGLDYRFMGDIICDDWQKIAEYLKVFSDERFWMNVYTLEEDETVKEQLANYGVKVGNIERCEETVYTGEPYSLTAPEGISMRELTHEDMEDIRRFYAERGRGGPWEYMEFELYQRDVLGNTEHSVFLFGMFKDGTMIGFSYGGLLRTHGFVLNDSVATAFLPGFESEELYRYAFKFVTNAALAKGALPFDDIQTLNTAKENGSGSVNSKELGYRTAAYVCGIRQSAR